MNRNQNNKTNSIWKVILLLAFVMLLLTFSTHAAADEYVDSVIEFIRPWGSSSDGGPATSAIGAPDNRFVSIDEPEILILAFIDNDAWDGPGNDVKLYEHINGDSDVYIYVSADNEDYEFIARTNRNFSFDLADYGLNFIRYLKSLGFKMVAAAQVMT